MTDKKDFTKITDLGEFTHEDDPEVDALFQSKTTIANLEDLADHNLAQENENDQNNSHDFQTDEEDEPFNPNSFDEGTEQSDFSSEDQDFPAASDSEFQEETHADFSSDNDISFDESDINSVLNTDSSEVEEYTDSNEGLIQNLHETVQDLDEDPTTQFSEGESSEDYLDNSFSLDSSDSQSSNNSEEFENIQNNNDQELDFDDDLDLDKDPASKSNHIENLEHNFDQIQKEEDDALQNMQYDLPETPEVTSEITSPLGESTAIKGSLNNEEFSQLSKNQESSYKEALMPELSKTIYESKIPGISTTYQQFKEQVKKLTYAPSPTATGPLFGITINGNLIDYKPHIQSLLQQYAIKIDLNEEVYLGPLNSGLIQVTRINEYTAISLTLHLKKYGFKVNMYYLDDLIVQDKHTHETKLETMELKGFDSEFISEQSHGDSANFDSASEFENILITKTSGPHGHKVLKRIGVLEKFLSIDKKDFESLQVNLDEFFNQDIHLSGASTLLDGLIQKVYDELKVMAKERNANAIVNFKLEQKVDITKVTLHFSGDLLHIRKLLSVPPRI